MDTSTTTVSTACDHDRHDDCHGHDCACGCHILFRLFGR
jgi:hypothetical protein